MTMSGTQGILGFRSSMRKSTVQMNAGVSLILTAVASDPDVTKVKTVNNVPIAHSEGGFKYV